MLPGVAVLMASVLAGLGRPWLAAVSLLAGVVALQPVVLRRPRRHDTPTRWRIPTSYREAPGRAGGAALGAVTRALRRLGVTLRLAGHLALALVGAAAAAVIFYLVLTPVGLGARLLGLRLLPDGRWHERPASPRAADRQAFVRAGGGRGTTPVAGRRLSWRLAIALIAVGAVGATLLPRLADRGPDDDAIPEQLRGATFNAFDSAALADADWKDAAGPEFAAASGGQTYTSYVGNSLRDFEGRYVNVRDRQRRSYRPAETPDAQTLDVWFFGGSTMFGFSAQRDLHTIPSEVVRLAEDDGVTVHAHNFGAPGYVNMQETVLAAQLLAAGGRPDLIVFYDGINDMALEFQQAYGGIGVPGDPSDLTAFSYRRLLAGQLTGSDQPPAPITPVPDLGRPPRANAVIDALVDAYGRGVELATALGDHYGIPVLHFWQPDLFNKVELVAGEEEVVERLGMDAFRYEAVARIARAIVPRLPGAAIDLSHAYDGIDEPVLTDQVHTNELGARLVAEAMYEPIADTIATLDDEGR